MTILENLIHQLAEFAAPDQARNSQGNWSDKGDSPVVKNSGESYNVEHNGSVLHTGTDYRAAHDNFFKHIADKRSDSGQAHQVSLVWKNKSHQASQ